MLRIIGTFLAALLMLVAAQSGATAAEITLFDGAGLSGESVTLTGSEQRLAARQFSERTSSIRVRSGTWRIYAGGEFRGASVEIGPGEYRTMASIGFGDNRVRSVELIADTPANATCPPGSTPKPGPNGSTVCLQQNGGTIPMQPVPPPTTSPGGRGGPILQPVPGEHLPTGPVDFGTADLKVTASAVRITRALKEPEPFQVPAARLGCTAARGSGVTYAEFVFTVKNIGAGRSRATDLAIVFGRAAEAAQTRNFAFTDDRFESDAGRSDCPDGQLCLGGVCLSGRGLATGIAFASIDDRQRATCAVPALAAGTEFKCRVWLVNDTGNATPLELQVSGWANRAPATRTFEEPDYLNNMAHAGVNIQPK